MVSQAVIAFVNALDRDPALKQELEAAVSGSQDPLAAAAAVACRHGQACTADDLRLIVERQDRSENRELTDEELAGVAGGLTESRIYSTLSNILKSYSDTQRNIISNLR